MKITCKFFVNIKYQLLIRVWTCFLFSQNLCTDPEKPTNPLAQRRAPSETLVATLEKINVYFRIRNLDHHVDLLHLFCSVETTIQDWSRQVCSGFIESPPFRFWYISINIWTTDWVTPDILTYIFEFMKL